MKIFTILVRLAMQWVQLISTAKIVTRADMPSKLRLHIQEPRMGDFLCWFYGMSLTTTHPYWVLLSRPYIATQFGDCSSNGRTPDQITLHWLQKSLWDLMTEQVGNNISWFLVKARVDVYVIEELLAFLLGVGVFLPALKLKAPEPVGPKWKQSDGIGAVISCIEVSGSSSHLTTEFGKICSGNDIIPICLYFIHRITVNHLTCVAFHFRKVYIATWLKHGCSRATTMWTNLTFPGLSLCLKEGSFIISE